jgi:hypothetical protein
MVRYSNEDVERLVQAAREVVDAVEKYGHPGAANPEWLANVYKASGLLEGAVEVFNDE